MSFCFTRIYGAFDCSCYSYSTGIHRLDIESIDNYHFSDILGREIMVLVEVNEQVTSDDLDLTVESRNPEYV